LTIIKKKGGGKRINCVEGGKKIGCGKRKGSASREQRSVGGGGIPRDNVGKKFCLLGGGARV